MARWLCLLGWHVWQFVGMDRKNNGYLWCTRCGKSRMVPPDPRLPVG